MLLQLAEQMERTAKEIRCLIALLGNTEIESPHVLQKIRVGTLKGLTPPAPEPKPAVEDKPETLVQTLAVSTSRETQAKVLDYINGHVASTFTADNLHPAGISKDSVRHSVYLLYKRGILRQVRAGIGRRPAVYQVSGQVAAVADPVESSKYETKPRSTADVQPINVHKVGGSV